jgi:hypothetical protein
MYRPILRHRRGELTALHHLDAASADRVTRSSSGNRAPIWSG